MDDKTLAQKRADLAGKYKLILEKTAKAEELTTESGDLMQEAIELAREINAEEERRKDAPGEVRQFRPRPNGPNPTDQGSR